MADKVFSDMSLVVLDRDDVVIGRIEGEWWFTFAEALARGYDREDAAQHGEPDPWSPEFPQDEHWERSRRICAFAGIYKALAPFRRSWRIRDLKAENARLLSLMAKAHAVMRETGWQLAPASINPEADGVLELAAAEIESEFADVLSQNTQESE